MITLQDNQSEVMRNMRHASVGEQYHLDKTLSNNIRLQNEITAEIKVYVNECKQCFGTNRIKFLIDITVINCTC